MASITFKGNAVNTSGNLPSIGETAKDFTLVATDLSDKSLSDYKGKNVVLNIFPSINTGICAESVRKFNEEASQLDNTVILCISKDLPFAQSQFCRAEGIQKVELLSDYRRDYWDEFGWQLKDGPRRGVLSRVVVVTGADGKVTDPEEVPEVGQEPDYDKGRQAIQ